MFSVDWCRGCEFAVFGCLDAESTASLSWFAEIVMREKWARAVPAIALSAGEAEVLIAPALPGAKVRSVALVEGGLSNTNLRVVLDRAPGAVLLRLWQRDPGAAKKEAALAKLLEGRVPVAQVLHLGEHGGAPYAVLEWI